MARYNYLPSIVYLQGFSTHFILFNAQSIASKAIATSFYCGFKGSIKMEFPVHIIKNYN